MGGFGLPTQCAEVWSSWKHRRLPSLVISAISTNSDLLYDPLGLNCRGRVLTAACEIEPRGRASAWWRVWVAVSVCTFVSGAGLTGLGRRVLGWPVAGNHDPIDGLGHLAVIFTLGRPDHLGLLNTGMTMTLLTWRRGASTRHWNVGCASSHASDGYEDQHMCRLSMRRTCVATRDTPT